MLPSRLFKSIAGLTSVLEYPIATNYVSVSPASDMYPSRNIPGVRAINAGFPVKMVLSRAARGLAKIEVRAEPGFVDSCNVIMTGRGVNNPQPIAWMNEWPISPSILAYFPIFK